MNSYIIHLIRNMPCEGNEEGRYIGRTESPLSDDALPRLLELKRSYAYPNGEQAAFYASPSTRCVDTLKILYPWADPEVIFEMAECDFGEFENHTAQELQDNPAFLRWMEEGGTGAPPGGESGVVFTQRVCRGFEMLVQNLMVQKKTQAVLCTHGGVIMAVLAAYGLPRAHFYDWMCEPGCGYSLRITPGLWMRSAVLEVYAQLPGAQEGNEPDHMVIDLAREAANRAYGGELPEMDG